MCSPADLAQKARQKVRDFGHFFEVPYNAQPIYTLRLPHPLTPSSLLVLWTPDGTKLDPSKYEVDQRNGIVKFMDPQTDIPDGVGGSGYYYEWFLDEDLGYAASVISSQVLYDTNQNPDGSDFSDVECDTIALGAVANSMWSLAAELSLDIDVSTPEGMSIPASQRFRQVWEMAGFWEQKYKDQSAMLNIGLWKTEEYWLRRVARLTNRLVPLIREREVDDPRPPQRIFTPIPDGIQGDQGELIFMPEPPGGLSGIGWQTIMTSGSP